MGSSRLFNESDHSKLPGSDRRKGRAFGGRPGSRAYNRRSDGKGINMAETVSWDGLRELAEFRAEKGCAISFYLDLDPKTTPTPGDAATRVSALLSDGERHAETNNRGLTHDQRAALKQDFAR